MSNASVVSKINELTEGSEVGEALRDLFLFELRSPDRPYKEHYRSVLARHSKDDANAEGTE